MSWRVRGLFGLWFVIPGFIVRYLMDETTFAAAVRPGFGVPLVYQVQRYEAEILSAVALGVGCAVATVLLPPALRGARTDRVAVWAVGGAAYLLIASWLLPVIRFVGPRVFHQSWYRFDAYVWGAFTEAAYILAVVLVVVFVARQITGWDSPA